MSIDELFETLSIKEIKSQHIQSRAEIETKKEELRFLVSERYRDIIDAADNIFDMKKCSEEVTEIETAKSYTKEDVLAKKSCIAAQIKLILNMSDLIWNSLEKKDFIEAAMQFSVCRNMYIHSQLVTDKYRNEEVDVQLMIGRQWSSLSSLEETISVVCKRYLQADAVKRDDEVMIKSHLVDNAQQKLEEMTSQCLVAIMLVEGKDIIAVLGDYLVCNMDVIDEWFSPRTTLAPVQQQLSAVAITIVNTISVVRDLFIKGRIVQRLQSLSEITVMNMHCARDERIYAFLPEQIALFKPAHSLYQKNFQKPDQNKILQQLDEWLKKVQNTHSKSIKVAFSHLTSVRSVYETFCELKNIFTDSASVATADNTDSETLENTCGDLKNVSDTNRECWLSLLETFYKEKLKVIIEENVDIFMKEWITDVEKFLSKIQELSVENLMGEDEFLDFLWTNSGKDVNFSFESSPMIYSSLVNSQENNAVFKALHQYFSNFFGIGSAISQKNCTFEALAIKLKAIRPEIFLITKTLNDQCLSLVEEVIEVVTEDEQFLWRLLSDSCVSLYTKSVDWCSSQSDLAADECEYTEPGKEDEEDIFQLTSAVGSEGCGAATHLRLAAISQALRSLCELLPAVQATVMTRLFVAARLGHGASPNTTLPAESRQRTKIWRLPFLPSKRTQTGHETEHQMWTGWLAAVGPVAHAASGLVLRAGSPLIQSAVSCYFRQARRGFRSQDHFEHIISKWDPIEVSASSASDPDAEDGAGNPATLTLKVPSQASWPMHSMLLQLCSMLVNLGIHALPRSVVDQARQMILREIVSQFQLVKQCTEFQENKLVNSQHMSLQLIFDLRFLLEIVNAKHDIEKDVQEQMCAILSEIEQEHVDPFDYAVMTESLHRHLSQAVARDVQLFCLLGHRRASRLEGFSQQQQHNQHQQHNIIELAGVSAVGAAGVSRGQHLRFGLLPISSTHHPQKPPGANTTSSQKLLNPEPTVRAQSATLSHPPNLSVIDPLPKTTSARPKTKKQAHYQQQAPSSYFGRFGSKWF